MSVFVGWHNRRAVAEAVKDDIVLWQAEYQAQYERDHSLAPRYLPLFRVAKVRHAAWFAPTEASQLPGFVVSIAGVRDHARDANGGPVTATLELGVRIGVSAVCDAAGDYLHHYLSVVSQLLTDLPTARGLCQGLVPVDEDYEPFSVESDRTLMGVDLTFLAPGVVVAEERGGPPSTAPDAAPRPDPYEEPWPDVPTADTTDISVDPLEDWS